MLSFMSFSVKATTLNAIMENVPDTLFIQELLPDFKAKTGIDVEFEIMGYGEMHPKMVPSLTSSTGSIDFMPVDFYWVGEFAIAGWMLPLVDYIKKDNFDTSVFNTNIFPELDDLQSQYDNSKSKLNNIRDKLSWYIDKTNKDVFKEPSKLVQN